MIIINNDIGELVRWGNLSSSTAMHMGYLGCIGRFANMSVVRCRDFIMSGLENRLSSHGRHLCNMAIDMLILVLWICCIMVTPWKSTNTSTCCFTNLLRLSMVVLFPNLYS